MPSTRKRVSKIKEGLECCAHRKDFDACGKCPYFSGCETQYGSFAELARDALSVIQLYETQLEEYNRYFQEQGEIQPPK